MFNKKLFNVLVFLTASILLGNEVPFEKLSPAIEVVSFHPDTIDGVYFLNDKRKTPSFTLLLKSKLAQKINLRSVIEIKDYFDRPVQKLSGKMAEIKPGETLPLKFELQGWQKTGHFTVTVSFSRDSKKMGWTQSAFIMLAEPQKKRDPFFMMDKNSSGVIMREAMKKIGCGSRYISLIDARHVLRIFPSAGESLYDKVRILAKSKESDFKLVGSASPDVKFLPQVRERLKKGLAPVSDADLQLIRKHYEKMARFFRNKIDLWMIQEEFDAIDDIPACKKDFIHYLSTYALVAKNTYLGLKAGNPDCKVAVLGICGKDYFLSKPKFFYSKMILNALGDAFDLICIDAYSGNWNAARGEFTPPEKAFRKLLLDTAELSASYGRPRKALNIERGYAVLYNSAFDSRKNRQQADLTARSLIINKSVPSPFYSIHLASVFSLSAKYAKRPAGKYADLGIWKPVLDEQGKNTFVPRRVAMAVATTARELAFTEFVSEKIIHKDVYLYSFTRKDSRRSVIAAWTTAKPLGLTISLPGNACITDIAGVKTNHRKGEVQIGLGPSPVFIEFSSGKTGLEETLRTVGIQPVVPVLAEARRIGPQTAIYVLKNISDKKITVEHPFGKGRSVLKGGADLQRVIKLPSPETDGFSIICNGKKIECKLDGPLMKLPHYSRSFAQHSTGKIVKSKPLLLTAPDDIYPKLVLMPEYGYFVNGFEKPSAAIRLAWDKQNLYVFANVADEKHMVAENRQSIPENDCFRFLVNTGNLGFSRRMGISGKADIYRFTLAGVKGCQIFRSTNAKDLIPEKGIKAGVKRIGNTTLYECVIPWRKLTGKTTFSPQKGCILGFAAEIVNLDSKKKPPYSLATDQSCISDPGKTIPFILTE